MVSSTIAVSASIWSSRHVIAEAEGDLVVVAAALATYAQLVVGGGRDSLVAEPPAMLPPLAAIADPVPVPG